MEPVDHSVKMHEAVILLRQDIHHLLRHVNTLQVEQDGWWLELGKRMIVIELWRRMLYSVDVNEDLDKAVKEVEGVLQETPGLQGEETTEGSV